jgi:signal peptidase II
VAVAAVAVDRLTKRLAVLRLPLGRPLPVLDGIVRLRRITNEGAAFGLFQHAIPVFVAVAVAVIAAVLLLPRQRSPVHALAYGLLAGGAFGNLWDRVTTGRVVDFIDVRGWPGIFNAADTFVVVGAVLLVLLALREGRHG